MKHLYALLLCMIMLAIPFTALCFKYDGIEYGITNEKAYVSQNLPSNINGAITIPKEVEYNGVFYPVTSIGIGAFINCTNLSSISLPNTITIIKDEAFQGCSKLAVISIPNSVITIGDYSFYGCSNLGSIVIPNSVTYLGKHIFNGCSKLINITLSNSLKSIEDFAFNGCNLNEIIIPESVTSIGYASFASCGNLNSITIPNSVTNIDGAAFANCSKLTSIMLGNKLNTIGNNAFSNCTQLMSIDIPNSVSNIGSQTFSSCSNLRSIIIPNLVSVIKEGTFQDCVNLKEITIPNSVINFENNAFYNCSALSSIHIQHNEPPIITSSTFYSVSKSYCTLYVPIGSKEKYANFVNWSDFKNIIEEKVEGQEVFYKVAVKQNEGGIILINGEVVTNSFVNIKEKEKVRVFIIPDDNFELEKLFLNENDITNQMVSNKFEILSLEGNQSFEVVFKKTPVQFAIKHANNGSMIFATDPGTSHKIKINPEDGWRINSVTFNDTDVTNDLDANNVYTTPPITQNATLKVSFESTSTPIFEMTSERISVFSQNSNIVIKGTESGTPVGVYSESGASLTSTKSQGDDLRIQLPYGTYIVKVGNRTFKVVL